MIFLLLISTVGVTINKHYSGGELFSTAFFIKADSCCETETPCACCNESSEQIKIETDYLATAYSLVEIAEFDLLSTYSAVSVMPEATTSLINKFLFEDASPLSPDLCILNQVFRL